MKSNLGRKRVYFSMKGIRAGPEAETWRQGLKQSLSGMLLTGMLSMACLACFLLHPRRVFQHQSLTNRLTYYKSDGDFLGEVPSS